MTLGRRFSRLFGVLLALGAVPAAAQAPFVTDDVGVTPARAWHVELFLSRADLQPTDLPAKAQTTFVATAAYGIGGRLELGLDAPWISIDQAGAETIAGVGDLNVSAKLHLRDYQGGILPGAAISAAIETPTGDDEKGLGSGVTDYGVTLIGEWLFGGATALRANLGVLFAGNNLTGTVGIRSDSEIITSGLSLTRTIDPRWDIGIETGYVEGRSSASDDKELFSQLGARYARNEHLTFAGGVSRGWYVAPEWTVQVGLIWDP